MRIVSRTARSLLEQKREKSMRKRQAAGTLATAFPRVEQIRIQLRFIPQDRAPCPRRRPMRCIRRHRRTSSLPARTATATAAST